MANAASVIGGFALMLFFGYAVQWVSACMGLNANANSPETAASFGFILLLPPLAQDEQHGGGRVPGVVQPRCTCFPGC